MGQNPDSRFTIHEFNIHPDAPSTTRAHRSCHGGIDGVHDERTRRAAGPGTSRRRAWRRDPGPGRDQHGAGDLTVQSGATQLFEGDFEFNVPALKPTVAYAVDGTTGVLKVSQGSASGNYDNNWHLNLEETTPIELHVNLGAGDAKLTLGGLNLQSVAIGLGAGDLVLDLRGTPASSYPVSVNAGAGDTTINLPASAGISVRTFGLIGDARATGLEKRDDRWINPRADCIGGKHRCACPARDRRPHTERRVSRQRVRRLRTLLAGFSSN